ncbi:MAG: ABC transporter permease subunit [Deltaproteobacteria bacterium]|nr:ABC transporter permease subunit [Deltaproteobacteria bacterium]
MRRQTPKELLESMAFLLPLALFLIAFSLYPVIGTLYTSLLRDATFLEKKFILFQNFGQLLHDTAFLKSVRFTLLFIAASVPLELFLGLIFAMVVNRPTPIRGFLRVSLIIPWAVPAAVSGRVWELIYNYSFGLANFAIISAGIADRPVNWLGSKWGAFFAIVAADVWKTTPFVAIILLAGLQAIPDELYQQAEVDSASLFRRFTTITLPLLRPALTVGLLFRTIDALRIFDTVYVITGGGPGGSTSSLSLYAYRYFLAGDFGYGSAISVLLFIIALSLSAVYLKVGRFREVLS